jgi:3-oxoacyl-[acyl-carrier protein] reductase
MLAVRVAFPGASIYAMTGPPSGAGEGRWRSTWPRGITVNNIQPGPTTTDMTKEVAEFLLPFAPSGPDGVRPARDRGARQLIWRARKAGFITGASLTIDGGYSV